MYIDMVGMWVMAVLLGQVWGLFFTLEPKLERCVGVLLAGKKEFAGAYLFTGQDEQNVIARLKSPQGYILHQSQRGVKEGKFELESKEEGIYRLCFRSTDNTEKIISFELAAKEGRKDLEVVTDSELEPLTNGLRSMGRVFDLIYRNIHFYQLRERTHRDLTERTCDRILWSAVGKMASLGAICLVQIYILKSLFKAKAEQAV